MVVQIFAIKKDALCALPLSLGAPLVFGKNKVGQAQKSPALPG
ncbi:MULTISPECIES: hypothetical protein [Comamonas]|nr:MULTISPECIES: hypothetical protein [Comamonas]